jgi:hypothetical protein
MATQSHPSLATESLDLRMKTHQIAAAILKNIPHLDYKVGNLTLVHPQAARKDAIINFTLKQFAELNADNNVVLLQYADPRSGWAYDKKAISEERDTVSELTKFYKLKLVDSYEILSSFDPDMLWYGHHTPFGNKVVCGLLYEKLP